jgi:hypothetical protein
VFFVLVLVLVLVSDTDTDSVLALALVWIWFCFGFVLVLQCASLFSLLVGPDALELEMANHLLQEIIQKMDSNTATAEDLQHFMLLKSKLGH